MNQNKTPLEAMFEKGDLPGVTKINVVNPQHPGYIGAIPEDQLPRNLWQEKWDANMHDFGIDHEMLFDIASGSGAPMAIGSIAKGGQSLLNSLLRKMATKDKKLASRLGTQLGSEATTKLPNVSVHQSRINNKNLSEPLITGRGLINRAKNMNVEDMSIFNNQFNDVSKYKKVYGAHWDFYLNNDKQLVKDIIANKRKMSTYADALYESGGPGWTGGNVGLPMSYGPSYAGRISSPTGSNIVGQKTLLDYVGFDSDLGKEILKKAYTR